MDRRAIYRIQRTVVGVVLLGIAAVAILGYAGSDAPVSLSLPETPAGEYTPVVAILGGVVVWRVADRLLGVWHWRRAGAATPLTPDGGGVASPPEFTGTVDGHSVRATHYVEQTVESDETADVTVIAATLRDPADAGVVVDPGNHGRQPVAPFDVEENADAVVDGVSAVGSDPSLAESVLTDESVRALTAAEEIGQVYAGDVTAAFHTYQPDNVNIAGFNGIQSRILWSRGDEYESKGEWTGGTDAVVTISYGTVVDDETLDEHVEAVVAVADEFERHT
jgi:hypothetical protein